MWGWGLRTDRVSISLDPAFHCQSFLIIIIIIIMMDMIEIADSILIIETYFYII